MPEQRRGNRSRLVLRSFQRAFAEPSALQRSWKGQQRSPDRRGVDDRGTGPCPPKHRQVDMKVLIEMFSMNYRKLSAPQLFSATLVAACASAALNAGQAKALVTYEFIQQGSDVVLNVSGSISSASTGNQPMGFGNNFTPSAAIISPRITGDVAPKWNLSNGPSTFGSGGNSPFTSYSGTLAILFGSANIIAIENYSVGSPISGSGLFTGTTLAGLGLSSTTPGLLASWNINGSSETVEVRIGSTAPSSVPGPLPLFGAAAAFAHSRRLRARLRAGSSSPLT